MSGQEATSSVYQIELTEEEYNEIRTMIESTIEDPVHDTYEEAREEIEFFKKLCDKFGVTYPDWFNPAAEIWYEE